MALNNRETQATCPWCFGHKPYSSLNVVASVVRIPELEANSFAQDTPPTAGALPHFQAPKAGQHWQP